jgi:hypothetical protein
MSLCYQTHFLTVNVRSTREVPSFPIHRARHLSVGAEAGHAVSAARHGGVHRYVGGGDGCAATARDALVGARAHGEQRSGEHGHRVPLACRETEPSAACAD